MNMLPILITVFICGAAHAEQSPREKLLLNPNWRFTNGDPLNVGKLFDYPESELSKQGGSSEAKEKALAEQRPTRCRAISAAPFPGSSPVSMTPSGAASACRTIGRSNYPSAAMRTPAKARSRSAPKTAAASAGTAASLTSRLPIVARRCGSSSADRSATRWYGSTAIAWAAWPAATLRSISMSASS